MVTGGRSGVMEAAAQGAREANGLVLGILPGADPDAANPHVEIVIPTGIGLARNSITALVGDIMVALPGRFGTLQEVTYALEYGRPVLSWGGGWDLPGLEHVKTDPPDDVELGALWVERWLAKQAATLFVARRS